MSINHHDTRTISTWTVARASRSPQKNKRLSKEVFKKGLVHLEQEKTQKIFKFEQNTENQAKIWKIWKYEKD